MSTWTLDKINMLLALAKDGCTAAQIAERVHATRNAVLGKIHRLGERLIDLNGDKRRARFPHGGRAPRRQPVAKMHPDGRPEWTARQMQGPHPLPMSSLPPAATAPIERARPCTLMDLHPDWCKWPINDGNPFLFCGAPRRDDSPYCERHTRQAYAPTKR